MNFKKIIHPCDIEIDQRLRPVFCKIELEDGRLSISGTIGPKKNGNAYGSFGQIDMEFGHRNPDDNDKRYGHPISPNELTFSTGWDENKWFDFLDAWKQWHLNGLKASCEHQRELGWDKDGYEKHQSEPCPTCGYKYGTEWNKVEVPKNIIKFLSTLPDTDMEPAWI